MAIPQDDRPVGASRARVVVAATAGILVESFDWTMYGLVAPYLSAQIFPGGDAFARVIGAYAVFAAGFLARPVGSAIMGRITDTRGRRAGLTISVALMALGSLVIALTPGRSVIGAGAAVIVFLARLLQGIAMGGEIATAATYVVEVAPRRRRHTFGAVAYSGDALGSLVAAAVVAALLALTGPTGMDDGGWRAAFAVGAALGLVAWWIRRRAPESPVFDRIAREPSVPRPPTASVLRRQVPRMLLVFAMTTGSTVGLYFATVYLPQFAAHAGHISEEAATGQLTVGLLVLLAAMIASGVLADRAGPLVPIRAGFTLLAVTTAPLMFGMIAGRVPFVVATVVFCLGLGLQLGVTPVAGARLFPVSVRAVALGVPAAVAIAGFGGTLPLVGEWLAGRGHLRAVVVYVTGAVTVSAVGAWLLREQLLREDDDEDLPGAAHPMTTPR